ncbi:tripartite tricarboxylate transporter TctB family protein [Flavimaricola marinus]|uniref:Tripartite tricarboxylate transporter TctB family protein n=1 Tax=Flavimaricola marinus TaxID=1819565 RepID=A0A238LC13_9RHOB|nr:tripartite tricarboxylate transporter TctB family protein [Flavimaricola marinus]SMY06944.1 Tripartite tricarboxylate transporter TctB family protein [Flavimaricola marinus]
MDPEFRGDMDHHDGTSDALPGGYVEKRRPGELGFAVFLTVASLGLLYSAYGISGFKALSSPGSIPMATSLVMVISALVVAVRTARLPRVAGETLSKDILPMMVVVFVGFLVLFGVLLKPLGFLPTAALFLIAAFKLLSGKSWAHALTMAFVSLLVIWLVFRILFTVLLPAGIVPEAEFIQIFRNFFSGKG